uniref:WW domain-containing protein n=1 Tax=Haptolina brevifila TaxID=156173 RepID=A0A7S2N8S6_9EUKA
MGGSAASIYQKDYRYLPYILRNGEMQVLSRWNMAIPSMTVSRVQANVRVSADGTATLMCCGKGPTLWRAWGGSWSALYKDEQHVLADGDQVSLDCNNPEAAVFSCHLQSGTQQASYAQQGYAQQGCTQPGTQQGYAQNLPAMLPAGWRVGTDSSSGATYYYNEHTGQSQWEPPHQGGYPQQV